MAAGEGNRSIRGGGSVSTRARFVAGGALCIEQRSPSTQSHRLHEAQSPSDRHPSPDVVTAVGRAAPGSSAETESKSDHASLSADEYMKGGQEQADWKPHVVCRAQPGRQSHRPPTAHLSDLS